MKWRPLLWGTLVAGTGLVLSGIVWGTWLRAGNGTPTTDTSAVPEALLANELPRLLPAAPIPSESPTPDASPPATERDQGVRDTINRFMPQASAEEREIWFQQFRELPPGVVEDLLKLRRETHGAGTPLWGDNSLMSPAILKGARVTPPVVVTAEISQAANFETLKELQRIATQNLLHSQTPGYCRLLPMLSPGTLPTTASHDSLLGLHLGGVQLSLLPGPPLETGRALDVAITAPANAPLFFSLKTPTGVGYTRLGRLEIDEDRRLGIRFAAGFCPLEPQIQLPEGSAFVEISTTGELVVRASIQEEWKSAGRLSLVSFSSPEHLQYASGGWFEATGASGTAQPAPDQGWSLRPRTLEGSNVEPSAEERQLGWVRGRRELLRGLTNEN